MWSAWIPISSDWGLSLVYTEHSSWFGVRAAHCGLQNIFTQLLLLFNGAFHKINFRSKLLPCCLYRQTGSLVSSRVQSVRAQFSWSHLPEVTFPVIWSRSTKAECQLALLLSGLTATTATTKDYYTAQKYCSGLYCELQYTVQWQQFAVTLVKWCLQILFTDCKC